jgi:hypothetical protein
MRAFFRGSLALICGVGGAVFVACVGDSANVNVNEGTDGATSPDGASPGSDGGTPTGNGDSAAPGDAGTDAADLPPKATGTPLFTQTMLADNIFANGVAFDGLGNAFIAGSYLTTIAVDFGNGKSLPVNNIPVNQATYDGFIAKFDSTGVCQWAITLDGTNEGNNAVIAIAAAPGGDIIFAADTASKSVKLDGAAVPGLGGDDITLGRLDPTGKQKWLRVLGSASTEYPLALATDPAGRIAIAGKFIRSTATDLTLDGHASNPPIHPNPVAFVAIADGNGTVQSMKAFPYAPSDGSPSSSVGVDAVAFDPAGNVAVGGDFNGSIELRNNEVGTSQIVYAAGDAGANDGWVAKLDSTTNKVIWGTTIGGSGSDHVHGVAVDPAGNVSVTFNYQGTVNVGATPLPVFGGIEVGLVRFDPNGGMPVGNGYGSTNFELPAKLAVDRWGEPILVGLMNGGLDLGGKPAATYGAGDGFIGKLTPSGAGLWAYGIGGSANNDQINNVTVDPKGRVACVGNVGGEGNPITLFGKTVNVAPGKNAAFLSVLSP